MSNPNQSQIIKSARLAPVQIIGESDSEPEQSGDVAGETEDLLIGLPDNTEEIDLSRSRLKSCSHLGLPRFKDHVKNVCLRGNFLERLEEDVFSPLGLLEELDLYDNRLRGIGPSLKGKPIKTLDLSFNLLRAVPPELVELHHLHTIYFVQNKISQIEHLSHLSSSLRSLELGSNRIRAIENLDALVNLEELWLGKNKITKLENLESLVKLRLLSIQSNRILKLEGLEKLTNLEELYLSHNGIKKIEGLENNTKLTTLDIGNNEVEVIENVSHLKDLQEFWASYNKIQSINDLDKSLGSLPALETVYLEGNPAQLADMAAYRRKVILALPGIKQVDATLVKGV